MFNFLKPKRAVAEQCAVFATSALGLWMNPGPQTQKDIAKLVEMGCDRDRMCVELTAFTVFSTWYGLRVAFEQGKLSEPLYRRMQDCFFAEVGFHANTPLPIEVSLSYDSLGNLIRARLDHYLFIDTYNSRPEAREKTIDYVCDFLCQGVPSFDVKFYLLSFLNLASFKVFDTLNAIRLQ